MTPQKIFTPGKFFLAGEYAALLGGSTLTVAVSPCFVWDQENNQEEVKFHPQSPAGLLSKKKLLGRILDPYSGRGGMGLSTAEFLFQSLQELGPIEGLHDKSSLLSVWRHYRQLHEHLKTIPSGVDLLTQALGGYVVTELSQSKLEKVETWPLSDLDWALLITGEKLKTHEHLTQDFSKLNFTEAIRIAKSVVESFKNKQAAEFVTHLNSWAEWLIRSGLQATHTKNLITKLKLELPIILAKGCGAMGADTVFILFDKQHRITVEKGLERHRTLFDSVIFSEAVEKRGIHVRT